MTISPSTIDKLQEAADRYNSVVFIEDDPVSIPHRYTRKQDIEIAGLFAAVFSWGQRPTIISKTLDLMYRMDDAPYDFVLHHTESQLKGLREFQHRTFNTTDLLYFVAFLHDHYTQHDSLEQAFLSPTGDLADGLIHFESKFASLPFFPSRTRKHVATPARNSTCKRINMYLRWMVRNDNRGVDFGIWKNISPASLYCPLDVHVERTARRFNLIQRKQRDWKTVVELTESLRTIDADDPVRFDFALFGISKFENL